MQNTGRKILIGAGLGLLATALYTRLRDTYRLTSFRSKVVVITGGSRGLGLVLARHFAAEGAALALLARDAEELDRAKSLLRSEFPQTPVKIYPCDCIERTYVHNTVQTIVQDFGRIDILVNDAGIISSMPLENTQADDYRKSLDTIKPVNSSIISISDESPIDEDEVFVLTHQDKIFRCSYNKGNFKNIKTNSVFCQIITFIIK